jgi:hypothetical protein
VKIYIYMEIFYTITLSVAVILLIMILAYVGLKLTNEQIADVAYPPNSKRCPDHWQNEKEGDKYTCKVPDKDSLNTGTLYGSNSLKDSVTGAPGYFAKDSSTNVSDRFDFTVDGWAGFKSGQTSECSKRTWAIEHGVLWDGITNYNYCD